MKGEITKTVVIGMVSVIVDEMKRILLLLLIISMLCCGLPTVSLATDEVITFDSVSPTGIVDSSKLSAFEISVDESIEVEKVELLENGVSIGVDEEAPFVFALDESFLGDREVEAIVSDSEGEYYYRKEKFSVIEYRTGEIRRAAFESYAGGTGNIPGETRHWVSAAGISFDRGDDNNYCLMYTHPGESKGQDINLQTRSFVNSDDVKKSSLIHFETDFYIDQEVKGPSGWTKPTWYASGANGSGSTVTATIFSVAVSEVTEDDISRVKTAVKVAGVETEIEQKRWYKLAFDYDWKTAYTTLWVDGVKVADNVYVKPENDLVTLSYIRGGGAIVGGTVAYDNWALWSVLSSPYSMGLSGDAEKLTYTEDSVTLSLSQGIKSVDTESIKLKNSIGEVDIESAVISESDNTITITPVNGFVSAETYELTIPANTAFTGGTPVKPLKFNFVTTSDKVDVVSGAIVKEDDVTFKAEVVNTSGTTKTFNAFLCLYKNGVFYKFVTKKVDVESGNDLVTITTPSVEKASGITYKAFVTDKKGNPVTDKFYVSEIN